MNPAVERYPINVAEGRISRLVLLAPDAVTAKDEALALLASHGLKVTESHRDPTGLLGGLSVKQTHLGDVYEHSFSLHPCADGKGVEWTVTGPGNGSTSKTEASWQVAANCVLDEYRQRGDLTP